MAKNSPYDSEYIKSVGAKLWRKLSRAKAFNEKEKKIILSQLFDDIAIIKLVRYTSFKL